MIRRSSNPRSTTNLNLEMVNRFGNWLVAQKYAPSTIKRYCSIARKLCDYIGRKPLSSVTPMHIGDFLTKTLPGRWADGHVGDRLVALRSFFDFLYLGGVVGSVAPRFLKARARIIPIPRAIPLGQVKRLILAAKLPRDRALVELLYATGCRIGELRVAKVEDINFENRTLRVQGKRKERTVYFGKPAEKSLRAYLRGRTIGYVFENTRPQQKGYVTSNGANWQGVWTDYLGHQNDKSIPVRRRYRFLGERSTISFEEAQQRFRHFLRDKKHMLVRPKSDRPMNANSLIRIVVGLARLAKIPKVTPHVLRHSFATHLMERGANVRAIQELMGHTWLTSTQTYMRISNDAVKSAFTNYHPRG